MNIHDLVAELRETNDSKIVLLVADGLGGLPMQPGGKTELETARTPNLDACVREGVPLVVGAALAYGGLVMAVRPGESACFRCAFPRAPDPATAPSCAVAGVLGPVAGVVGSFQAAEALKLLTGVGRSLLDRFLEVDGEDGTVREVATSRRPDCRACGDSAAPV